MNHNVKKYKFGSSKSQMNSILRNLAKDLFIHEHVTTTKARAKAVKSFAEKLIVRTSDDLNGKRYLESHLGGKGAAYNKVFDVLLKRFENENSGLIHSYKVGFRKGDGAELIRLVLKGFVPETKSKLKKVKKSEEKVSDTAKTKKSPKTLSNKKSLANLNKSDTSKSQVSSGDVKEKAKSRSGI